MFNSMGYVVKLLVFYNLLVFCYSEIVAINKISKLDRKENFVINNKQQYIIWYTEETVNPARINVYSHDADKLHPVLVVVKQERRVTSWEIPMLVETSEKAMTFQRTSRTLCYDSKEIFQYYYKDNSKFGPKRSFTVTLSSSSPHNIHMELQAEAFKDFILKTDQEYTIEFSASQPKYFSYTFPKNIIEKDDIKTVLVQISSKDETCFIASVQPKLCPVRDLSNEVTFDGIYQTINGKGGITVSKFHYPYGFLLVFVAKGDNHDCIKGESNLPTPQLVRKSKTQQVSVATFKIHTGKTIREYVKATTVIASSVLGCCLFFALLTYVFYHFGRYRGALNSGSSMNSIEVPDAIDSCLKQKEVSIDYFLSKGKSNKKRSTNYFWHVTNVAIFYGIPVIQLMISYQRTVNWSGNLDTCYHNFYCSQPLYFTDFNHIFSNIGYVLFGILYLAITLFKKFKVRNVQDCGVPKFYGIQFSMGMALIFEGFLSACYHICPNQSNFQFDTSFMYVMAVLIMVTLYQNRHPDISASTYKTFTILGFCVILAMIGILFNSRIVMFIFIFCYITLCLFVSFKIYYFGHVIKGWKIMYTAYNAKNKVQDIIKPIRIGRFVVLSVANIFNFSIGFTGLILYPRHVDFGTFLLGVLMINAILHACFYVAMKLICGERICYEAILYGVLSILCWGGGSVFFLNASTQWALTPAKSREFNMDCVLMNFYDYHDIWHLISAPALFFSFMFLQTLDDDLFNTPYHLINAF